MSESNMPETNTILFSLASSIVGGLIVAATNHFFTRSREKERQLKELRVKYLIEAWTNIQKASDIEDFTGRDKNSLCDGFESAVANVMLLGNFEESQAAREFAQQFNAGHRGSAYQLLNTLRKNLRRELSIEEDNQGLVALRLHREIK